MQQPPDRPSRRAFQKFRDEPTRPFIPARPEPRDIRRADHVDRATVPARPAAPPPDLGDSADAVKIAEQLGTLVLLMGLVALAAFLVVVIFGGGCTPPDKALVAGDAAYYHTIGVEYEAYIRAGRSPDGRTLTADQIERRLRQVRAWKRFATAATQTAEPRSGAEPEEEGDA